MGEFRKREHYLYSSPPTQHGTYTTSQGHHQLLCELETLNTLTQISRIYPIHPHQNTKQTPHTCTHKSRHTRRWAHQHLQLYSIDNMCIWQVHFLVHRLNSHKKYKMRERDDSGYTHTHFHHSHTLIHSNTRPQWATHTYSSRKTAQKKLQNLHSSTLNQISTALRGTGHLKSQENSMYNGPFIGILGTCMKK